VEKFNYSLQDQQKNKEQEKFVTRRMVIKIGSSTITCGTENLDVIFMENITRQVSVLFHSGVEVMIVTSGAVASGGKKGSEFGQTKLIMGWGETLKKHGVTEIASYLLTDNDLVGGIGERLKNKLKHGVSIINGQDAVNDLVGSKICKDNDKLAGFLAKSIGADTLLLLTDKDGVLDKDGKTIGILDPTAEVVIFDESKEVFNGGIDSKVRVAREFNGRAIIADGRMDNAILKVAQGKKVGTEVKSAS